MIEIECPILPEFFLDRPQDPLERLLHRFLDMLCDELILKARYRLVNEKEVKYEVKRILITSRIWNLPFKKFSSYIIEKLGRNLASIIVTSRDIDEVYGERESLMWEELLSL